MVSRAALYIVQHLLGCGERPQEVLVAGSPGDFLVWKEYTALGRGDPPLLFLPYVFFGRLARKRRAR